MITTLYAAILAFLYLGLAMLVIRGRWKFKIGLGDGGNAEMQRLIRMHGNFVEYVPFALILLFMLDYAGFSPMAIHVLGIMLVIGRVAHAIGLHQSGSFTPGRGIGMALTLLMMLVTASLLLWVAMVLRVISF